MSTHDVLTGMLAVGIPVFVIVVTRLFYRWQNPPPSDCNHCLHWLMSVHGNYTRVYTCCKCGRVVTAYAIEREGTVPWRPRDHGPYICHERRKDMIA